MEIILISASVVGIIFFVLVLTHVRSLTEDEVKQLGIKRRKKQIRKYFSFVKYEFNVNKEFKKRMNPNGSFYQFKKDLSEFPSTAAGLLKYKKHEWLIIAFEKLKIIELIYLNKGFDRSVVSPYISTQNISDIAKEGNYSSILIFHNHPNSNPNYYDYRRPSSQDLISANEYAHILNKDGINLVEFVCEKGIHYEYFLSSANSFLPITKFVRDINRINEASKIKNLLLHVERIF